jgi:hypothetical protein
MIYNYQDIITQNYKIFNLTLNLSYLDCSLKKQLKSIGNSKIKSSNIRVSKCIARIIWP